MEKREVGAEQRWQDMQSSQICSVKAFSSTRSFSHSGDLGHEYLFLAPCIYHSVAPVLYKARHAPAEITCLKLSGLFSGDQT